MLPVPNRLALKLTAGIGVALLLVLLVQDRNHWKAKTTHYAALLSAERGAHAATVANVRTAVERARMDDAANAARVKAAQGAINQRSEHDYESRIAAARAAARRLRRDPAPAADPGSGRSQAVPGLPAAATGPSQAAGEIRLSNADALTATEQAIQLDELIQWVRQQAAVEVSRD
jgi:hypothetical protein